MKWHLYCLILVQMLAFSLLDAIVAVDWQHRWLNYLNLKGYLKHMVEGLAHEDHMLQSMLDPSPEPLKVMPLLSTLTESVCIYFHTWSFINDKWIDDLDKVYIMKKRSQIEILRKNSFSEYFDLRTLLHYVHFIQVINPFIISTRWALQYGRTRVTHIRT